MKISRGVIKALFHQLVEKCGGTEPVAVKLGVTPQRVSQLQSPNSTDVPNLLHVLDLEEWIGEPVVNLGLANLIRTSNEEHRAGADLGRAIRETLYAATDLSRRADGDAQLEELRVAAQTIQSKLDAVTAALGGAAP